MLGFSKVGLAAMAGVTGGALVLGKALRVGFGEFSAGQKVAAQTNAVLKSTGGIAGVSAKQVDGLARALQLKTGVDDEVTKSGENLLLTFTGIRNEVGAGNDIFTQTTKIMTDMSVALGQDTKSSAIQLGKALNDPIKGVTALQRVGVSFTAAQKEQIKALESSGHHLDAQKLILRELQKEFGGSAVAAGKTFGGQLNILRGELTNVAGDLVGGLMPSLQGLTGRLVAAVPTIQKFGGRLADAIGPALTGAVRTLTGVFKRDLLPIFRRLWDIGVDTFRALEKVVRDNEPALRRIGGRFEALGRALSVVLLPIIKLVFVTILPAALRVSIAVIDKTSAAIAGIVNAARGAAKWVKNLATSIKDAATTAFRGAKKIGKAIIDGIVAGVTGLAKQLGDSLKDSIGGALHSVKSKFHIGSPSKWTNVEIGVPLAQGIIDGFVSVNLADGFAKHVGNALNKAKPKKEKGSGGKVQGVTGPVTAGIKAIERATGGRVNDDFATSGHAPNSYHYKGQAIDFALDPAVWAKLYANRRAFAELFGPPGLFHYGVQFYNATLQRQHRDHIHVAYTGGPALISKMLGGGGGKDLTSGGQKAKQPPRTGFTQVGGDGGGGKGKGGSGSGGGFLGSLGTLHNQVGALLGGQGSKTITIPGIGKILVGTEQKPTIDAISKTYNQVLVKLKAAIRRRKAKRDALRRLRRLRHPKAAQKRMIKTLQDGINKLTTRIEELKLDLGDLIGAAEDLLEEQNSAEEQAAGEAEGASSGPSGGDGDHEKNIRDGVAGADTSIPIGTQYQEFIASQTPDQADDLQILRAEEQILSARLAGTRDPGQRLELGQALQSVQDRRFGVLTSVPVDIRLAQARAAGTPTLTDDRALSQQVLNLTNARLAELEAMTQTTSVMEAEISLIGQRNSLSDQLRGNLAGENAEMIAYLVNLRELSRSYGSNLYVPFGAAGTTINLTNHYAIVPEDPHIYSKQIEFELRALVS